MDYASKARNMKADELFYALADVVKTLELYKTVDPTEPYAAKLWAEFDAYSTESHRRRHGR